MVQLSTKEMQRQKSEELRKMQVLEWRLRTSSIVLDKILIGKFILSLDKERTMGGVSH